MKTTHKFESGKKSFLAMSDAERKEVLTKSIGVDKNAKRRAAKAHAQYLEELRIFAKEQRHRNSMTVKASNKRNGVTTKVTRTGEGSVVEATCQCFGHKNRVHSSQACPNYVNNIEVGTIVQYSIGSGCHDFWQVVSTTPRTITVRKIKEKAINVNVKCQTCDDVPLKDDFLPPKISDKYVRGFKAGNPVFKKVDKNTMTLKVVPDERCKEGFRIGPTKRMMGWSIWDKKPQHSWCP